MARQAHKFWIILCTATLLAGLWSIEARCQELDSARQAYRAIAACLGLSLSDFGSGNTATLDTSNSVKEALNAGGRQVVVDWPFNVTDSVTIASNTFRYALSANFMQDSLPWERYVVFGISKKGDRIYNVPLRPVADFDVIPGGPGSVAGAQIIGRMMFIFPAAPSGDKLYVHGPGEWVPVTSSVSLLTAVPEDRLWGAVYFAAAFLLEARRDPSAQMWWAKYREHVTARRGAVQ